MKVKSTALYPIKEESLLRTPQDRVRALKHTNFLLQHLLETIDAFVFEHAYHKFDAHVGEALCQIRAYAIIMLKSDFDPQLNEDVLMGQREEFSVLNEQAKLMLDKELAELKDPKQVRLKKLKENYVSLEEILQACGLRFDLDVNLAFILQLYILTKFREINLRDSESHMNYDSIIELSGLTRGQADKTIKIFQQVSSKISADFVCNLLADIAESSDVEYFLKMIRQGDRGLTVPPCYETTRIIMEHMVLQGVVVVVKARRFVQENERDFINLVFEARQFKEENRFVRLHDLSKLQKTRPCFVCDGKVIYSTDRDYEAEEKSLYIERLLRIELGEMVLMQVACHPQYIGKKLNGFSLNPYQLDESLEKESQFFSSSRSRFEKHMSQSLQQGFERSNPSTYLAQHIYCDTPLHHFGEDAFKVDEKPKTRARGNTVRFEVPEESRKLQQASAGSRKRSQTVGSKELLGRQEYRQNPPSLFFHSISAEVVKGKSVVAARAMGQGGAPVGRWSCV